MISPFSKPRRPIRLVSFPASDYQLKKLLVRAPALGGGEGLLSNEVRKMGCGSALLDRETNEQKEIGILDYEMEGRIP